MSESQELRTFPIEDGTIENFNACDHKRGRSWVAVVFKDLSKPGQLDREFFTRAPAGRVTVPKDLRVGMWLEFAGDYYTTGGNKQASREYFQISEMTAEEICVVTVKKSDVGRKEQLQSAPAAPARLLLNRERLMILQHVAEWHMQRNVITSLEALTEKVRNILMTYAGDTGRSGIFQLLDSQA